MKISIVHRSVTEGRGRRVVPVFPVFPLFSYYPERQARIPSRKNKRLFRTLCEEKRRHEKEERKREGGGAEEETLFLDKRSLFSSRRGKANKGKRRGTQRENSTMRFAQTRGPRVMNDILVTNRYKHA